MTTAPPSPRALTVAWLKVQPEFIALAPARAYQNRPTTKTYPFVVVDRVAGGAVPGHHHWLHNPLLQVTCYGGRGAVEAAHDLASVCAWLIDERLPGRVSVSPYSATVTGTQTGAVWEGWDPVDGEIAVARFDARVHLHP